MQSDHAGIVHAGQFVAGTEAARVDGHFQTFRFFGLEIAVHEQAMVTRATSDAVELLLIGDLFDPANPAQDNFLILQGLARVSTFEAIEIATSSLAGRWLLFAKLGRDARLYPDASASRAVFYGQKDGLQIASQPGLLAHLLPADPALARRVFNTPSADAWPAALTPHPGVRQLLPNRYIDLATGEAKRFWPVRPIAPVGVDDAARAFTAALSGVLRGLHARDGSVALPLTGGIDSRVLLACALRAGIRVNCFTVVDGATPLHDFWLPLRISSRLNVRHEFLLATRSETVGDQKMRWNTGGLWRDPNEHRTYQFANAQAPRVALGTVSEVSRCFYYRDGQHPEVVDATLLACLAGWGADPLAIEAYGEWLEQAPRDSGINLLDLFYLECRLGNWAALDAMALDTFKPCFSPFNCRGLFEAGLGVDLAHRAAPYELYRKICELTVPELLDFPVNTTWLQGLRSRARELLPRDLREHIRGARRRIYGLAG